MAIDYPLLAEYDFKNDTVNPGKFGFYIILVSIHQSYTATSSYYEIKRNSRVCIF